MMLRLAFRNCFRNTRRTVITALSVFIASLIVIVVMAFMYSIIDDMVSNERLYSTADIRIRNPKYSKYESLLPLQFYVDRVDEIKKALSVIDQIDKVEEMSRVYASLYNKEKLSAISVIGASPSSVFFSKDAELNEGRFLEEGKKEAIVTSRFLVEHSLSVGDSITVVFKTANNATDAITIKIVGSVSYPNAEYNSALMIMDNSLLSSILHLEDGAIELYIWLKNRSSLNEVEPIVKEKLSKYGLEVKRYEEISSVYPILPLYDVMIAIIVVLFFFIASTLVFNTMMMSVLERKKEISTCVALGFSRNYVVLLFVLEGIIISTFGALLATIVGKILITIFAHVGIDLTLFGADAVDGWSFPNMLYPHLSGEKYLLVLIIEVLVAALSSFLASKKIKKLEVSEELREEA